ncbi:hypothetical protein GCM10009789_40100 [Kribbella sancticallisti]|uniref:Beta-lactamase-related domain-containing protein n=1 Tax=Kribbella sancticallisti TaxID=460087 RepID=A0ABN2DPB9_9ACTN
MTSHGFTQFPAKGSITLDNIALQDSLDEMCREYQVVGASLAVHADDQTLQAASGVLNVDTGVEATTDSVFQVGSITKAWTATLALQLVDDGLVRLDEPIASYLPEFRVADTEVRDGVTLRHLLTHTSGLEGDHFVDTGRGDDCLGKYVESCAALAQTHPLGATMSYCNSGYSIAGHLIERLRRKTWDEVLVEGVIEPLGLSKTTTLPEEVLRFRAAIGHVGDLARPRTSPRWGPPRSAGPAGLLCSTAGEVVTFARMHLDHGRAPGGSRLLTPESAHAMQSVQATVPDAWTLGGNAWGLGWALSETESGRLYGHDGSTFGQRAFLRIAPDARVVIVLLTTGGRATEMFDSLASELLEDLAGFAMPARPRPAGDVDPGDALARVGIYQSPSTRLEFTSGESGALHLEMTDTSSLAGLLSDPSRRLDLLPVRPGLWVTRLSSQHHWVPAVFFELESGQPYVHFAGRATPRVELPTGHSPT